MDIKAEDLLNLLDLGEVKTLDEVKEKMNKKFVSRQTAFDDEEIRTKATGKVTSILQRKLKDEFELSDEDVKGKQVEEYATIAATKFKSKIEHLESESKKSTDQAVQDWQAKYEKVKKEAGDYKSKVENYDTLIKQKEQEFSTKEKSWKINSVYSKAKEKVSSEYHSNVKELELIGFEKKINDTYQLDIGENEEVLIYDRKTQKRVEDTAKLGSYISLEELLKREAATAGLLKKNEGGSGKQTFVPKTGQEKQTTNPEIVNNNLSAAAKRRMGLI